MQNSNTSVSRVLLNVTTPTPHLHAMRNKVTTVGVIFVAYTVFDYRV